MATVILKRCHEYDAARLQALLGEAMESLDLPALRPGANVQIGRAHV